MRFIDTNIFLRYLTQDDEIKAATCFELFQRLQSGTETATTCEAFLIAPQGASFQSLPLSPSPESPEWCLLRFFAGVKAERARDALLIPVFSPPEEK